MDLSSLWKGIASLVVVALRSFALTVVTLIGLGIVLAGVGFYLGNQSALLNGVLAAVAALVLCTVLGVYLAGHRAVAAALVRGLRDYRYGETLVNLLFERILGVSEEQARGERGVQVVQKVERLPLAQAEARLTEGVTAFLKAPVEGGGLTGWLRRKLQGRLLRLVRDCTLTRFREEGANEGGVDLVKVQNELGQKIDSMVIAKIRGAAVRMTVLVVTAAVLVSVGIALGLQRVSF